MSFLLTLNECVAPLKATSSGNNARLTGVSIDTRTLVKGDLYVAIAGERFDGHDFIERAEAAGAAAILAHQPVETQLPVLMVEDTRVALGQLARFWAQRFAIPTVAITGSNGKTTVKEIIATILRQLGPVLSTKGNLNNDIGVPLTLLEMRDEHLYAVIEMGANHAGEISELSRIARPDVAVITNIGTAHLEGFGSVEGIARAKSEIYAALGENGHAVINADDTYADWLRGQALHCRRCEFGFSGEADISGVPGNGLNFKLMRKTWSARFPLSGNHNDMNALAAIAAVHCLDVQPETIVRGLEKVRSVPGRLEKKPGARGATLIDDSYNANPDSAEQAIRVLARYEGKRYLVLGDMAELGSDAEALHVRVGEFARDSGLDGLWTTGPLASSAFKAFSRSASDSDSAPLLGAHCIDQESLIADLKPHLGEGVTILVKGSRSAGMERVVKALMPIPGSSRIPYQEQRS